MRVKEFLKTNNNLKNKIQISKGVVIYFVGDIEGFYRSKCLIDDEIKSWSVNVYCSVIQIEIV